MGSNSDLILIPILMLLFYSNLINLLLSIFLPFWIHQKGQMHKEHKHCISFHWYRNI